MNEVTFARFAAENPAEIAIVDPHGETWTRGELASLVRRLTRALGGAGLVPGDALAIVAPNCAEFLAAYLAAIAAGLYVVPMNWHLAPAELARLLEDSNARAVIAHCRLGGLQLATLLDSRPRGALAISIGAAAGYVSLEELTAGVADRPIADGPWGRVMPFTSATTGRAKAVKLPLGNARGALARMVRWHESVGVLPEDGNVHLCASMLYHSAPLEGAVAALHMGHRVVLVDRWDPERLLEAIERQRVTTTFLVPTMFVRLLKLPPDVRNCHSTATLRFVVHGGAPCPVEVKRAMLDWWGPILWEAYGAAEAQGTMASAAEWLERPGTVGRAVPGARIAILGEDGEALPPRAVGKVYLVPYNGDRFEYLGDPEKTHAAYRGELVTVGDVGYVDEDGYLFLCGRRGELIISSGMNIYPAEIEQVLVQHPAVADCAVVGEPHALLGEVPIAIVQPMPGFEGSRTLSGELLEFLGERLSAMKLPKRVDYVEHIPRDPSGKLFRRLLDTSITARQVGAAS